MNRLILFAPFALLLLIALGGGGLLAWNKVNSMRRDIEYLEGRNENLEDFIQCRQIDYELLLALLHPNDVEGYQSILSIARYVGVDSEEVRDCLAAYESQVTDNLAYLPKGDHTYPAIVRALSERARETEARLRDTQTRLRDVEARLVTAEAKLSEVAEASAASS